MSKLLNVKTIILAVLVIAAGVVVVYNPGILHDISNLLPGNSNQGLNYDNATLLPPFPTAKYNLAGGNQYADLHFSMDVGFSSDSYQYTNMHFVGTISNMTALTNDTQVNRKDTFTFTTNVTSCLYGQSQNPVYNEAPTYIPNATSAVTAGDINQNGQDEYIAVYSTGCKTQFDSKVTILEWNESSNNFTTWADFHIGLYDPQVLALDLKGTGHSQLIIAGFKSQTTTDLSLMFIDFAPKDQPVLNDKSMTIVNKTLTNTNLLPNRQIFMDKGNIDNSLDQEFFIYGQTMTRQYTCIVYKYNFKDRSLKQVTSFTDADLGRPIFASLLQNAKEQLIIPKREEIVPPNDQISSPPTYSANTHTNESGFIYDVSMTNTTKLAYFPYRGIVGAGNLAGTGTTDIIELDYCFGTCTDNVHIFTLDSSYALKDSNGNYIPLQEKEHFSIPTSYYYSVPDGSIRGVPDFSTFRSNIKILTSDINFDAIPEILIQGPTATRFYLLRGGMLIHSDNSGNIIDPYSPSYNPGYLSLNTNNVFEGFSNASTTGNFFNQSIEVTYQQKTFLSDGKPTILAVMAAPPTKDGISQNYGNTQTSFGQSTSQSSSNEQSVGYSIGAKVTIGYEGDVSFFGAKIASFGASVSASFDYATTQTQKVTKTFQFTNTWTTDSNHNGVVYSATKYRNWNYTILDSSNPAFNGKTMTFSYPYYVGIFKFDANQFDTAHPGYNINTGTFNHTIGNPATYPTKAQATSLTTSNPIHFMASDYRPVNQGGGADEQTIDVSTELSSSTSVDYTVGASATVKAGVGGAYVEAEASASKSWGETSEVSIGKGTTYSATIGQISNTNDWNQWSYGWGMFVYLKYRPDLNISYQVIDFYTGNFGTGYIGAYYKTSSPITAHAVAMNIVPVGYQINPTISKNLKNKL